MEIHQLLPGYHYGDAISNHALMLKRLLNSWGHTSQIYTTDAQDKVEHECRPFDAFEPRGDTITIYHYSIGRDDMTRRFQTLPGKRLLIYHNITPHHYLAGYNEHAFRTCKEGRETLPRLRDVPDMVLGDSHYNCRELVEHGFKNPRVLPIALDAEHYDRTAPCQTLLRRFADDWTNFLFVGRITPNKRQDDVIRVFAHYNRMIDRRSRLFLVGSWRGMDSYQAELRALVAELGLEDHVVFSGHIRFRELVAYYKLADVFVCMSEHEGFCVPILEALHHDIPVIAYSAAAVPDTLGDAGILVTRKDFGVIAETAHLLVTNQELCNRVLRRQCERLADFEPRSIAERFKKYVEELIAA